MNESTSMRIVEIKSMNKHAVNESGGTGEEARVVTKRPDSVRMVVLLTNFEGRLAHPPTPGGDRETDSIQHMALGCVNHFAGKCIPFQVQRPRR